MRLFLQAAASILLAFVVAEATDRAWRWADARARFRAAPLSFELYAIGESTAAGVPYPRRTAYPFLVKKILGGTIDKRTVAVNDLAAAGETIYPQATALARALAARGRGGPGAVFVYAGNNDAFYDDATPFFEFVKEEWLYRSLLLRDLLFFAEKRGAIARVRTLQTYEYHLRRAIETARRAGLTPVLSTVVYNLRDMDPGESPAAAERFLHGRRLLARGRFKAAKAAFRAAVETRAPDNFGRATGVQNRLIRRLAAEYRIPLVDAEAVFDAAAKDGIPGDDLFIDGQHPNFRGAVLLADAHARALSAAFGVPIFEPMKYSPALLDDLGVTRDEQSLSEVEAGRWLLSVSARRADPRFRLDAAEARFRAALRLDPASFSARLGLALTDAARRGDFLERHSVWLGRRRLFYGGRYELSPADLAELTARLKAAGVEFRP